MSSFKINKSIVFKVLAFVLSISYVHFTHAKWWGENCHISPLPETQFCIFCRKIQGEWTKWSIDAAFDDMLIRNGWEPKQVALAVRLLLRYSIQKSEDKNSIPVDTRYQQNVLSVAYNIVTSISPLKSLSHFNDIQSQVAVYTEQNLPELRLKTWLTSEDFNSICENNIHHCFSDQVKHPYTERCVLDCNKNGVFDSEDSPDTCDE